MHPGILETIQETSFSSGLSGIKTLTLIISKPSLAALFGFLLT
jgi:hypothetical protein